MRRSLSTDRLRLIPLGLRHAGFVYRLSSEPQVRRYLGGVQSPARRVCRAFTAGRVFYPARVRGARPGAAWCVRPHGALGMIGLVTLSQHKDGAAQELSYEFLPRAWGKGFAQEGGQAALAFARDDLGLRSVIAETQSANAASLALLKRLGFKVERRIWRFGAEQTLLRLTF